MGSQYYRGSGGNGDIYLDLIIDYHGKTAGNRGYGDNFSSITAVEAVMGTEHCVQDEHDYLNTTPTGI